MDDDEQIMTIKDLSSYLRVHPSTIYRMLKKKQIPCFQVGSDWRFLRASIVAWMKEKEQQ